MTERMTDEHWAFLRTIDHWSARESDQIEAELDRARANEARLEEALNVATRELESLKQSTRDKGKLESRIRAIVREEIRKMDVYVATDSGVTTKPFEQARWEDEP